MSTYCSFLIGFRSSNARLKGGEASLVSSAGPLKKSNIDNGLLEYHVPKSYFLAIP
jgi:hypothetical protein